MNIGVRAALFLLLSSHWVLLAGTALADEPAKPAVTNVSAGAAKPDADSARAMALFDQAEEKYMEGDLPSALRLMEESYDLSQRHELLFNLGQLNQELSRCSPALERYRSYLRLVPSGVHRKDVESEVARLTIECPEPTPVLASAGAVVVAPVSPDNAMVPGVDSAQPYWTTRKVIAWSAIGMGVIAEAGALYFALSAQSASQDVDAIAGSIAMQPAGMRMQWDSTAQSREAAGERDQTWAIVLGISGVVLGAGGAILLATTPEQHADRPAVSLMFPKGGLGASYSASF